MDFGNSMSFAVINGDSNILEIPTAVVPLSDAQAEGYFTEEVPKSKMKQSLMIRYEGKNYLIGDAAKKTLGNDNHIRGREMKSESLLPLLMFYAMAALHEAEQQADHFDDAYIEIDYFSTMLPIWEVTKSAKFSDCTNLMASRFLGEHHFSVMTSGCQKDIHLHVKDSFCYIEGLAAKWALRYKLDLSENETAEKFRDAITINVDIGGGTIDLVRLQKRLENPKSQKDFDSIVEATFFGTIQELYERKLRPYHFASARDVEEFIVKHYEQGDYVVVDGKTSKRDDISGEVHEALRNFTNQIMPVILDKFPNTQGEKYKYNYFGGVAPILRPYIEEYVTDHFGKEVFKEHHHIEPDRTARFLNLYGLEIISRQRQFEGK